MEKNLTSVASWRRQFYVGCAFLSLRPCRQPLMLYTANIFILRTEVEEVALTVLLNSEEIIYIFKIPPGHCIFKI